MYAMSDAVQRFFPGRSHVGQFVGPEAIPSSRPSIALAVEPAGRQWPVAVRTTAPPAVRA